MHKFYFWAALLYTVGITVACLVTMNLSGMSSAKIANSDKYAHFIFYFFFTTLWYLYFKHKFKWIQKKRIIIAFISASVYGIFIEVCQDVFTTTRQGDVLDALANMAGSASAGLLLILLKK